MYCVPKLLLLGGSNTPGTQCNLCQFINGVKIFRVGLWKVVDLNSGYCGHTNEG